MAEPASGPTPAPERAGTAAEQIQRLYEDAESKAGQALEGLVGGNGFAELLSLVTSNAVAVIKLGGDTADALIRAARLAGRSDVARLARQLARTEDKLELVLQELRGLQARVESPQQSRRPQPSRRPGPGRTS